MSDVNPWIIDSTKVVINTAMVLGEGSFGKVYEGMIDSTRVAVKVLKATFFYEKNMNELLQEAEKMGHTPHENILGLYKICPKRPNLMLITQL